MTFEDALKILAEKEPEKFEFIPGEVGYFSWGIDADDHLKGIPIITQDDIDEILALIGWVYQTSMRIKNSIASWNYIASHLDGLIPLSGNWSNLYPTKLEAAKAALIAVVEREYTKEKQK